MRKSFLRDARRCDIGNRRVHLAAVTTGGLLMLITLLGLAVAVAHHDLSVSDAVGAWAGLAIFEGVLGWAIKAAAVGLNPWTVTAFGKRAKAVGEMERLVVRFANHLGHAWGREGSEPERELCWRLVLKCAQRYMVSDEEERAELHSMMLAQAGRLHWDQNLPG